jgi:hypothetical protein
VQYTSQVQANEDGNAFICYGQNVNNSVAGRAKIQGLAGSWFPFESDTAGAAEPLKWLVRGTTGIDNNNKFGAAPEQIIDDTTQDLIRSTIQEFGSAVRYLGAGLQLIPTGSQGSRKGYLFSSVSSRGGWNSVAGVTEYLTHDALQNMPNYVEGAVANEYAYATLFPKAVKDIDYMPSDTITNIDDELTRQNCFGSVAIGVTGGLPEDTFIFRFILHLQVAPSRSIMQLLNPIATRSDPMAIARMFDEFKTHCENHMYPADAVFDTYVSTLDGNKHEMAENMTKIKVLPVKETCHQGTENGKGLCIHKNGDSHRLKSGAIFMAQPAINMGKIGKGIMTGIKTVGDVARPLLSVAEALAPLFGLL